MFSVPQESFAHDTQATVTLENVVEPARENNLSTDVRFPMVVLPELKLAPPNPVATAVNGVKRPIKQNKKKETDEMNTKTIPTPCDQYALLPEVRLPSLSLSHIQQYDAKKNNVSPVSTFDQFSTPQLMSDCEFQTTVNGVSKQRKSKSRTSSLNEFSTGSVRSTSSDAPATGDSCNKVRLQPKFSLPKSSSIINDSTPETMLIQVDDLNNVSKLQSSFYQPQTSYQEQFVNHTPQRPYQPVFDQHQCDVNMYNGNLISQQYTSDRNSFDSSQNYSSPPFQGVQQLQSTNGFEYVTMNDNMTNAIDDNNGGGGDHPGLSMDISTGMRSEYIVF